MDASSLIGDSLKLSEALYQDIKKAVEANAGLMGDSIVFIEAIVADQAVRNSIAAIVADIKR